MTQSSTHTTYTTADVAAILKTTPRSAARWCFEHRVARMKLGREWRFDRGSFDHAYRRAIEK